MNEANPSLRSWKDGSIRSIWFFTALDDALSTFEATGTTDALPRLMRDLAARGVAEGYAAKELTALVEMLAQD